MALENPKHQKIASLLAQGFKPVQVASIIGCTPALISQLIKDPEFKEAYEHHVHTILESVDIEEEERLNNKYLAAEHRLLDSISDNVPMMEDGDKIKALSVIAARQEKKAERILRLRVPQQPQQVTIVQLALPAHAVPEYQVNSQNEILAIGHKALAPMSSNGVQNLFRQMEAQRKQASALPAPADF